MQALVLDTNVLVLLVIGLVDRRLIATHKRSKQFTEADFDLLGRTMSRFGQVIVTTAVLTETSNLLANTHDAGRAKLLAGFANFVRAAQEDRLESTTVVREDTFLRLGLTDAGLMMCVRSGHALLTADLDLYLAATQISERVENFNHLRQRHLLS